MRTSTEQARRGGFARRWTVRVVAAFCGVAAALVLLEVVLRWTTDDPLLAVESGGFVRLAPNATTELVVAGRTTTIRTNNLGIRGADIGPRQPGERRVLCLGDSFPFGFGVEGEEAFPALLERSLQGELGAPVVIANASFPGYGTVDQLPCFLRLAPELQPELVVSCVYLGNDFLDNFNPEKAVVHGHVVYGPMARLMKRSWRARLMARSRVAFTIEMSLARYAPWLAMDVSLAATADTPEERGVLAGLPSDTHINKGLYMDAVPETDSIRVLMDRAVEALVRLRDRAAPVPLLVIVFPSVQQVTATAYRAELDKLGLDPAHHEQGMVQTRLLERCRAHGLEVMDTTPVLRAQPDPDAMYIPGDGHLSIAGHALVARWLTPILAAHLAHAR